MKRYVLGTWNSRGLECFEDKDGKWVKAADADLKIKELESQLKEAQDALSEHLHNG